MKKIITLILVVFLGGCASPPDAVHAQKITQGDKVWYSCDVWAGAYGRVRFTDKATGKQITLYGSILIEESDISCPQ